MGNAPKWFCFVFCLKKSSESSSSPSPSPSLLTLPPVSASKPFKDKRQWSFVKSYRESGTTKTSDFHHIVFTEEAISSSGHINIVLFHSLSIPYGDGKARAISKSFEFRPSSSSGYNSCVQVINSRSFTTFCNAELFERRSPRFATTTR